MPLQEGKSDAAVSANIATEMHAGKPQPQAIAIAMRKAGRARDEAIGGAQRGRDIFYGARDQQPGMVTTPNASVPAFTTQTDDDDDD